MHPWCAERRMVSRRRLWNGVARVSGGVGKKEVRCVPTLDPLLDQFPETPGDRSGPMAADVFVARHHDECLRERTHAVGRVPGPRDHPARRAGSHDSEPPPSACDITGDSFAWIARNRPRRCRSDVNNPGCRRGESPGSSTEIQWLWSESAGAATGRSRCCGRE